LFFPSIAMITQASVASDSSSPLAPSLQNSILDCLQVPVVVLDSDGCIVAAHRTDDAMFGQDSGALLGSDFVKRFVSAKDHDRVRRALKRAVETENESDVRFAWTNGGGPKDSVSTGAHLRASTGKTIVDAGFKRSNQCTEGGPLIVVTLVNRSHETELEDLITHISEDERCRIGEDLHDLIASRVTAVSIRLQNMRHLITDGASDELVQTLDSIIDEVWDVAGHVRSLSHTLFPIELEETTLSHALHHLVETLDQQHTPTMTFLGDCNATSPDDVETATHLYRIAHEAVHNALHHAAPDHVWVQLSHTEDLVDLSVWDDGPGIDEGPTQTGLGLHLMQCRADVIGADLRIGRAPRGGTLVRCLWTPRNGANGSSSGSGHLRPPPSSPVRA
jgi:signal transduction histidine kinase